MAECSHKPTVWVIDAEQWPRACLRAELMERGFEVIAFDQVLSALAALRHRLYEKPVVLVIELHHLTVQKEDIQALTRLSIPKLLLGGAIELNEAWVKKAEWAAVIKRPFTIGKVADAVEQWVKCR